MILQGLLTMTFSDLLDHRADTVPRASIRPLAGYRRLRLSFFRG